MFRKFLTKGEIIKRLKSLSWNSVIMLAVFVTGFVSDDSVKALIGKYPEQLGWLVTLGLISAQITKLYNNYVAFKNELRDLEDNQ
jgi:hypothetical protein